MSTIKGWPRQQVLDRMAEIHHDDLPSSLDLSSALWLREARVADAVRSLHLDAHGGILHAMARCPGCN